ncbi:BtrH N-terminal domain-containing protein [Pseudoalteromonas sp. SSM20]|uniref:BtrH N-terminal domain-containing protein n=1 Tax=Pseudoalteromonas sp. SSM20 TaxID=3139394 RepID=UPI003BAAC9DC
MMPVLNNLVHKQSSHCESGVVSNMLSTNGLTISEPMAFGIASAMSFAYLPFVKVAGMPLIAYRMPPKTIINTVSKKLGIKLHREKFSSAEKGMKKLDEVLAEGKVVGLQTSVYWLPYFPDEMRFHFNAHNLMVYGIDEHNNYQISDPVFENTVTCPKRDLEKARFSKGALAPKGLMYWVDNVPSEVDLTPHIYSGIKKTAKMMAGLPVPGINLFGTQGMEKLAKDIERLDRKPKKYRHLFLAHIVRMQEEIGTGGAGFRFMFASFLDEAAAYTNNQAMFEASQMATDIGDNWRNLASLAVNHCRSKTPVPLSDIAAQLRDCAKQETALRTRLLAIK